MEFERKVDFKEDKKEKGKSEKKMKLFSIICD